MRETSVLGFPGAVSVVYGRPEMYKHGRWSSHIWIALATCTFVSLLGCRRDRHSRIDVAAVERCELGVTAATKVATEAEALRIYFRECQDIHAELACREAFAAASKAEPEQTLILISEGCRKAYCPILGSTSLELCKNPSPVTSERAAAGWPALHGAIIAHDAKGLAARVERALLRFLAHWNQAAPTRKPVRADAAPGTSVPSRSLPSDAGPAADARACAGSAASDAGR